MLVGAVLGPQQREHRQLDVVRLAAELLDDQLVLGVGEAELAVLGHRDGHGDAVSRFCTSSFTPAPADRDNRPPRRVELGEMRIRRPIRAAALLSASLALCAARPGPAGAGGVQAPGEPLLATTGDARRAGPADPDRAQARRPRPGGDAHRPAAAGADRGRRPPARRAARSRSRPPASSPRTDAASAAPTTSTRRSPPGSCSRPSPKADSGFLPLSASRTVLCKQRRPNRNHHCTIAIPNTETHDHRPRGAALQAQRLLRQPDRRRPQQEGEAGQRRRPRRRPARRLGRAGQGPAQRRPGPRRRPGAGDRARARRWSTTRCR